MIKKLNLFFRISAALLIFLAGEVYADSLEKIIEKGTLRVGVSLFAPWTMEDKKGELSGFEIDVAKELAQDMGVKPKFIIYKWEDIIAALKKGEIDIIAGGMAITPARALKINFTQPYADSGIKLATNIQKTQDIKTLKDLNQQKVIFAVVSKTVANELVGSLFGKATVKLFKTAEKAEQAVVDGVAHAYVASSPQPEFLVLNNPDKIDMPLSKALVNYKAGFGVRRGQQELLNFLNSWITARTVDKWLPAVHKYWFGSLEWNREARK